MHIRKYAIAILLLFFFLQIKATGSSGDVIYIDGEKWDLMAKPIYSDSILYKRLIGFLPKNQYKSFGDLDGITAVWEIRNNSLYLQRLKVSVYDKTSNNVSTLVFNIDKLKTLFAPYYDRGEICARWFSGELRAGQGEFVRYVHLGFDRNVETERIMNIKHGKVLQYKIYHNYKKPGLNLHKASDEISKRFPWKQFPEYKGQRLGFSVRNFQLSNDGHLLDFDVSHVLLISSKVKIEDNNHPLIKAFKKTLKSIYPWEILYIYGKYKVEYSHFIVPIQEKNAANKL